MLPVLRGGAVAWAALVFLQDVDVLARKLPGHSTEEERLRSEELHASRLQVGWATCWTEC